MGILTKVAKGLAFGDVSNSAVRNVLTEISKSLNGKFTEQEMIDTMEEFDWKCPYTGRDLKSSIEAQDGSYATDHIYPQNAEWCGLNIKGNLVIVDKKANSAKGGMDVETFLLNDEKSLGKLDLKERQKRLQKIKDFQKKCGYNPEEIRKVVAPLLEKHYAEVRSNQQDCIDETLDALKGINIYPISSSKPVASTATAATTPPTKKKSSIPELIFYPSDVQQFKDELLKSKKGHFVLTYDSGAIKNSPWKADKLDASSDLKNNIMSRSFWRNKKHDGLIKVEVFVD